MHLSTIAAVALALLAQAAPEQTEQATPAPGTVTVEPLAADANPPEVKRAFAEAVEHALFDARFTPLPGAGHGRYIARFKVTRSARGAVMSNAKEEGADGTAGNWGAQLRVTMPSNKTQLRGLVVTELEVEIVRRGDMQPVWSGRALTAQAQGTSADTAGVVAKKLADAVIRTFPARSADAVSVP
jgi:hypothetical protein